MSYSELSQQSLADSKLELSEKHVKKNVRDEQHVILKVWIVDFAFYAQRICFGE